MCWWIQTEAMRPRINSSQVLLQSYEESNKSPFEIVYTKLRTLTVDLAIIPFNIDLHLEEEEKHGGKNS